MIVDAQVHLWPPAEDGVKWPDEGVLKPHLEQALSWRRFLPLMNVAGVDRALIMPPPWVGDDLTHAIEAAECNPGRFGIVPSLALDRVTPDDVRNLAAHSHVRALRAIFTGDKSGWIEQERFEWLWSLASSLKMPIMILAPDGLPLLAKIAQRHLSLRLIVDHMGLTVHIARSGRIDEQLGATLALASCPNIFVKLTSVATYSNGDYPFRDMTPRLLSLIEAFGPDRCFWGTDLTMAFHRCSYEKRVLHFQEELRDLPALALVRIMGAALLDCIGWH